MSTNKKKSSIFIHPYRQGSKSAKALAEALGARRILTGGRSKYKHSASKLVINWGSSTFHVADDTPMLNHPDAVKVASNKLTFFRALENTSINLVPFTEDPEVVEDWLAECQRVCVRQKLTGHSGEGLLIINPKESCEKVLDIPPAKLYTKYVPKALEYRVHVVQGKVIRIQKKILRPELSEKIKDSDNDLSKDDINWEVRNHDNGFVYVTNGVADECPESVTAQAIKAVRACKLDFGAVDIIFNNRKQKAFVLEINTSPGLEGETLEVYAKALSGIKNPLKFSDKKTENLYLRVLRQSAMLRSKVNRGVALGIIEDKRDLGFSSIGSWSSINYTLSKFGAPLIDARDAVTETNRLFCEAVVEYYEGQ